MVFDSLQIQNLFSCANSVPPELRKTYVKHVYLDADGTHSSRESGVEKVWGSRGNDADELLKE